MAFIHIKRIGGCYNETADASADCVVASALDHTNYKKVYQIEHVPAQSTGLRQTGHWYVLRAFKPLTRE